MLKVLKLDIILHLNNREKHCFYPHLSIQKIKDLVAFFNHNLLVTEFSQ